MVALVEWTKERVRHGYMVVLVSQVNGFGEFKESKALAEGGWSALMLTKKGSAIEVRVGDVRQAAITTKGVLMQMDGARISEVCKLGTTKAARRALSPVEKAFARYEPGATLTTAQIVQAMGMSRRWDTAERYLTRAVKAGDVERISKGTYRLPVPADIPAGVRE
jgi:hypothetical protein